MDAVKSIVWGFRFFLGRAIAVSGRTWEYLLELGFIFPCLFPADP